MSNGMRYADGWDFTGRSDEYLCDTYALWAVGVSANGELWEQLFTSGMNAIVEESHARALVQNRNREAARTVADVSAVMFSSV